MSTKQPLSPHTQLGQAIVLVALMIIVIIGAVGLAVDGGISYYYNASAERAAAAAALSGVVFMPAQFSPAQAIPALSGNDATDRALVAAKRNGFDPADVADNVAVNVAAVPGASNKLSVTVSRTVNTFFMQVLGLTSYTVSRTAIATYLPPLKLGQPGGSVGSTVSQLGTANNFYFLRTEGWATDRGQGDAYTPNTNSGCSSCPSTDQHQISTAAGTDSADPTLPFAGGYNYMVTVPVGSTAQIQVYNAAFAPDSNNPPATGPNFCENWKTGFAGHACSSGGNYFFHEDDSCCFAYGTANTYSAMKYSIFNAPSVFIRSSDTLLSQMLVKPVDASNWAANPPTYKDVNTGKTITQKYNAVTGAPTNMLAYHSWLNVGGYVPDTTCVGACTATTEAESSIISYTAGYGPIAALGPGTYRLRIDTLEYNGSNPCNASGTGCTGTSYAHKGMAARVTDGGGVNPCAGCTMSALDDMSIFTPISISGSGSFQVPIFQLTSDYAGQTISVDVWDPGDVGGTGNVYLGFIDPTTNALVVEPAGGPPAVVWDLFGQRSNYGTGAATQVGSYANPAPVEQQVVIAGANQYNAQWVHFDLPIPSTYNPVNCAVTPANCWWKLQYRATGSVTAADTITITLNLKGNPAHLLQS